MHPWLVLFHIVAAFAFVLSHGASSAVALVLRRQNDAERVRALLELSRSTAVAMYVSLALMLASGILVGFSGHWWSQIWIWLSLGLLVLIGVSMSILGSYYFNQVRVAVGLPPTYGGKQSDVAQEPAAPEELHALLRSRRPIAVSVIDVAGLVVILWLMVLKPFLSTAPIAPEMILGLTGSNLLTTGRNSDIHGTEP